MCLSLCWAIYFIIYFSLKLWKVIIFIPTLLLRNSHSQKLRNVSKVTYFICGRTQIQTDLITSNQVLLTSHYALMFTVNPKWHHCKILSLMGRYISLWFSLWTKKSRRTNILKYYELNVLHAQSLSLLIILWAGLTINSILQIRNWYVKRLRNLLKVFSQMQQPKARAANSRMGFMYIWLIFMILSLLSFIKYCFFLLSLVILCYYSFLTTKTIEDVFLKCSADYSQARI